MASNLPPHQGPPPAHPASHSPDSGSHQNEKHGGITRDDQGQHHFHHQHITEYVHMPKHFHLPRGIHEDGESGRKGFHPWHFIRIVGKSSCVPSAMVNILWPFVPAAIAMYAIQYAPKQKGKYHIAVFALNYIAMVPAANLLGFAGQELARKLPKVFGVVLETFLGGIVEIVLFTVLIVKSDASHDYVPVIRDAILGSILANLLFCMGLCFVAGGMRHVTQKFDGAITEVGCGLLFMAAFGLAIPRAFAFSLSLEQVPDTEMTRIITRVSRIDAIILLMAFVLYVVFQMFSHHGLYTSIFEADELNDRDRADDLAKDKLTLTECIIAIVLSVGLVSVHAVFLVGEISYVISESSVKEMFLGLILVPLVEKFAEHLTAIDEAWDNTMNMALSHVLGATLQTALLNTPLVVLIGWGLGKDMNLNFAPFHVILVILAVLAAGSFLRDQESNYLEGSLCVLIYVLIAATAWYYPNPAHGAAAASDAGGHGDAASTTAAVAGAATEAAHKFIRAAAENLAHRL